jgi:hypothetical protein
MGSAVNEGDIVGVLDRLERRGTRYGPFLLDAFVAESAHVALPNMVERGGLRL